MFYIHNKTWKKVIQYAESAHTQFKSEISGMLIATLDDEGDWEVHSPVILKQKVSAGNTVLNKEELAKYYAKTGKKYKGAVKFVWWHSHHTMSAFWSGTDHEAIKEYADGDWSLALVVNLKEEYKFRVSYWNPIESHEDIDLLFIDNDNKPTKIINDEVKNLCNQNVVHNKTYKRNFQNGIRNSYNDYYPHENDGQYEIWERSDSIWIKTLDFIDNINGKYFIGTINYEEWKEQAVSWNTKDLAKQDFYIEICTESVLDDKCITDVNSSFIKRSMIGSLV